MKIKESYKYFTSSNFINIGFILLIIIAVNLFSGLLIQGFTNEGRGFMYLLNKLTPNLPTFVLVIFIYSMVMFRSSMAIGNQFGRTRLTSILADTFSMLTIIIGIAFLVSLASVTYLTDGGIVINLYEGTVSKFNLFIKEFFWAFTFIFNAYAIGTFIAAIWNRVKPMVRLIIFVGIPVSLSILIPRIYLGMRISDGAIEAFLIKISTFFGYSSLINNPDYSHFGINIFQNTITTTFVISIPLIILSYLLLRKSTLNDRKTN